MRENLTGVVLRLLGVCAALAVLVAMTAGSSGGQKKKGDTVSVQDKNADEAAQKHELLLTDANFAAETAKSVVLVDFWAPWCGPCRMQGPIVEKVAVAMASQAKVGKCNVDEARKTAERFAIRSIPTLVILKNNREVERFVGVQQESVLIAALKKHLK